MTRLASRIALAAVAVLALTVGSAWADPIQGEISFGFANAAMQDAGGNKVYSVNDATQVTFTIATAAASAVNPGDFSPQYPQLTTMNEVGTITLTCGEMDNPFVIDGYQNLWTFTMDNITGIDYSDNGLSLDLWGTGYVEFSFQDLYIKTDGIWDFSFTDQNGDGYYDWSGSFRTTGGGSPAAVPEPGTIVLLGSGLLGAVALVRRRNRKADESDDK